MVCTWCARGVHVEFFFSQERQPAPLLSCRPPRGLAGRIRALAEKWRLAAQRETRIPNMVHGTGILHRDTHQIPNMVLPGSVAGVVDVLHKVVEPVHDRVTSPRSLEAEGLSNPRSEGLNVGVVDVRVVNKLLESQKRLEGRLDKLTGLVETLVEEVRQ